MSFELTEIIMGGALERGARRNVLAAIAHYADVETGLARVSHVALGLRAGASERTVYRVLSDLLDDPDLDGLVRCVRRPSGRGNAAVYRLDVARLLPLVSALKVAGRRIFAGVPKAMADRGLTGAKASPANMLAVFGALAYALREEDETVTARTVEALQAEFEAAMARRAEISVIGTRIEAPDAEAGNGADQAGETGPETGPEPVDKADEKPCQNVRVSGINPDILAGNPDILTMAYSKESSPSGITPLARAPREPCGKLLVAQAARAGEFLFDAEGLLAHATVNRRERLALLGDLQGRLCRVLPGGLLAIRARNEADAEALAARWLEALVGWASDVGLAGVVVDAPFAPEAGEPGAALSPVHGPAETGRNPLKTEAGA